jgi:hypothetical protein
MLAQVLIYQWKLETYNMDLNIKEIIKQVQKAINPSTFKKAVISKVNSTNGTADVYFVDNPQNVIKNIPLASNLNSRSIQIGARCRVDCFDESNPNDMVIAYIYGGASSNFNASSTGTASVSSSGTTIAHGLGVIPTFTTVTFEQTTRFSKTVSGGGGGSYLFADNVYEYQAADSTNIYLKAMDGGGGSINIRWKCDKF